MRIFYNNRRKDKWLNLKGLTRKNYLVAELLRSSSPEESHPPADSAPRNCRRNFKSLQFLLLGLYHAFEGTVPFILRLSFHGARPAPIYVAQAIFNLR